MKQASADVSAGSEPIVIFNNTKQADLRALRAMATYLRDELLRLESDHFWSVALLPEALDYEASQRRIGGKLG